MRLGESGRLSGGFFFLGRSARGGRLCGALRCSGGHGSGGHLSRLGFVHRSDKALATVLALHGCNGGRIGRGRSSKVDGCVGER